MPDLEPEPPIDPGSSAEGSRPTEPPSALAGPAVASYSLPTARQVVSAGLQLALASTGELRRGSIYIGLLLLGAIGPAVLYGLTVIAGFHADLGAFLEEVSREPDVLLEVNPQLVAALLGIELLFLGGVLVLIAISIDAQGIAIALLGARATNRPMRLWEAILRARAVFWRLAGTSSVVGITSFVLGLALALALGGASRSETSTQFLINVVTSLVVAPWAYLSTCVVIGDVGVGEALRRSVALFRARKLIAIVVVLFTLVTAGIESFALGSGLDLLTRAADALHVDLSTGGLELVLLVLFALAAIVALGSLIFTIAAIVAAPQVVAFLGLTFYSGGIDRARIDGPRPRLFRWVSLPMLVLLVVLWVAGGLAVAATSRADLRLPAASLVLPILVQAAHDHGDDVELYGRRMVVEDPVGDESGGTSSAVDITAAEYVELETVPGWMLSDLFDCGKPDASCTLGNSAASTGQVADEYAHGAILVLERLAGGPPDRASRSRFQWASAFHVSGHEVGSAGSEAGASDIYTTTAFGADRSLSVIWYDQGRHDASYDSVARSVWIGNDLLTLIPSEAELLYQPEDRIVGWDVTAQAAITSDRVVRDSLRLPGDDLQPGGPPPYVAFYTFDATGSP